MKNYLEKLDKQILHTLKDIGQEADQIPLNAFVVGGPVRDILLKRKFLDVDVVVEGDAAVLAKRYAEKVSGSITVHDRFGTATVHLKDGSRVDFATARQEEYPSPGVLPVVKSGFINDDLFRRDFTVNAMAIRINHDRFGQLVDEFGGSKDLKARKIRILHEQSFKDDPTRILRAVRFEQRLSFQLEPKTLLLLKTALKKNYPLSVAPERYFVEFRKILQEAQPAKSLKRLAPLGGLKFLDNKNKMDLKVLSLIEKDLKNRESRELWLVYLMGLVHLWSTAQLERLGGKFNLRRHDRAALLSLPALKKAFFQLKKKNLNPSEIFKVLKPFSDETILFLRSFRADKTVRKHIDDFLGKYRYAVLSLNGHDLKAFGVEEGKEIKEILDSLLMKKLDGKIKTKEQEQQEAQKLIESIK